MENADRLSSEADRLDKARDYRKALRLWLQAAELGDTGAMINAGNYYAAGKGTRKNLAEAERFYRRAYKAGQRAGASNIACDKRDVGNYRSAILWFKKAIAMSDGDAALELAKMQIKRDKPALAVQPLKIALTMTLRRDITENGYEEAERLLRELQQ